jgi:hypothetical protein
MIESGDDKIQCFDKRNFISGCIQEENIGDLDRSVVQMYHGWPYLIMLRSQSGSIPQGTSCLAAGASGFLYLLGL